MTTIDVLLVEDSDTDADLTIHRLKKAGYSVNLHRVRDGEECMAYLRDSSREYPDVVFLDLNMPKKDGREVLGEMMVDQDLHMIPIVIMTTSDLDVDKDKAFRLGANAYVVKPGDVKEYEDVMQSVDEFWFSSNRYPPKRKKP